MNINRFFYFFGIVLISFFYSCKPNNSDADLQATRIDFGNIANSDEVRRIHEKHRHEIFKSVYNVAVPIFKRIMDVAEDTSIEGSKASEAAKHILNMLRNMMLSKAAPIHPIAFFSVIKDAESGVVTERWAENGEFKIATNNCAAGSGVCSGKFQVDIGYAKGNNKAMLKEYLELCTDKEPSLRISKLRGGADFCSVLTWFIYSPHGNLGKKCVFLRGARLPKAQRNINPCTKKDYPWTVKTFGKGYEAYVQKPQWKEMANQGGWERMYNAYKKAALAYIHPEMKPMHKNSSFENIAESVESFKRLLNGASACKNDTTTAVTKLAKNNFGVIVKSSANCRADKIELNQKKRAGNSERTFDSIQNQNKKQQLNTELKTKNQTQEKESKSLKESNSNDNYQNNSNAIGASEHEDTADSNKNHSPKTQIQKPKEIDCSSTDSVFKCPNQILSLKIQPIIQSEDITCTADIPISSCHIEYKKHPFDYGFSMEYLEFIRSSTKSIQTERIQGSEEDKRLLQKLITDNLSDEEWNPHQLQEVRPCDYNRATILTIKDKKLEIPTSNLDDFSQILPTVVAEQTYRTSTFLVVDDSPNFFRFSKSDTHICENIIVHGVIKESKMTDIFELLFKSIISPLPQEKRSGNASWFLSFYSRKL